MFLLKLHNTDPVLAKVSRGGQRLLLPDPCLLLLHLQVEFLYSERLLQGKGGSREKEWREGRAGEGRGTRDDGRGDRGKGGGVMGEVKEGRGEEGRG